MLIEGFIIFLEMISIALINNCAMSFEQEEKFDILTWLYVGISTVYMLVLNIFPAYSTLILLVHLISCGYCFIRKRSLGIALYATVCGLVLMTIIEMLFSIPSILVHRYIINDNRLLSLIINVLSLITVYGMIKYWNIKKVFNKLYWIIGRKIYLVILFAGIFILFSYKVKINKIFGYTDFMVFSVYFATILGVSCLLYQENVKNIRQKYENEQLGIYSQAYDTVLKDIRARQHEYNNHINNIVNMHMICKDYETLVKCQTEYVGELKESYKYNSLLNNTKQPVVSGFLYMKFLRYEETDADIKYNINLNNVTDIISVIDLIEILGVLLDNAFQALGELQEVEARRLSIAIEQEDETLMICIANTLKSEIKYDGISRFFKEGYTTKGYGHGMGLYNLKRIVKRYKGEVSVYPYCDNGNNWIEMKCIIKKKQELIK